MLSERAQILLKTLVERYVEEGQPVGSRTLSKHSGLSLSPASIRNIMADLEDSGYIVSPHTSAGRIPTPQGYRFFVDSLLTVRPLDDIQISELENKLHPDEPQRLVSAASRLLSNLSKFAGVVAIPRRRSNAFRRVEFLSLSEKRVLLVIVTVDGEVQNRIILTDRAYSSSELTEASNFFNHHYSGCSFADVQRKLSAELKQLHQDMTGLMTAILDAGSRAMDDNPEDCVISGETNLLNAQQASSDLSALRKLFNMFEQKTALLQLLDRSQAAQGVQIFIGGESGLVPFEEFSVVTAPYERNGQVVGTLGVIGPTRMAYERVIPIVDITAKLLSNALSQQ